MNPYAAENHDAGFGFVDITTKPGVNSWHGSFNFGFRDEAMNGRQVFAPFRGPEQQRRFRTSHSKARSGKTTRHFFSTLMARCSSTRADLRNDSRRNGFRSRISPFKTIESRRAHRTRPD
jgi:hypothetical protein